MDQEKFASKFGKLVINLKSIEFFARAMLGNKFQDAPLPKRIDLYKIGDSIPKGYLTEYKVFRNVIEKFKKEFDFDLDVDHICLLRNAIAHGRLSSLTPKGTMHMFNTKDLDEKNVELEWIADLDESWFKKENDYVMDVLNRMVILHQSQSKQ